MKVLKLRRDQFWFGGSFPTQLEAMTHYYHYVYGRLRHGRLSLEISSKALDENYNLFGDDYWPEKNPLNIIFEVRLDIYDGECSWQEFVELCEENGVKIKFFDAIDYMKNIKEGGEEK